jgi:hypothetical protein
MSPYVVFQGFGKEVSYTAEPVEKVQTANFDNFGTVRNQELPSHRKIQNAQFSGFSTGSLFYPQIGWLKKLLYGNHSCNNLENYRG